MKFLTVAAAIFASTSLAVPTNNHNNGGACVPRPDPGNSNTSSAPGGDPTGGHTSSGPGTKPTDSNTSSGPGTKPTGGNTSSGPGPNPTSSHTNSVPATTTTDSNTGSHTSSSPSTTSTGHPGSGGDHHCSAGLYSNLQCCSTDVLGVLGLDCRNPSRTPTSGDDFKSICAAAGKQAKCCVLPVAGQDVLCQDAIGGGNPTVPGGHPTSVPGGHPTSVPGGSPTSVPGGHPTSVPGDNSFCPAGLFSSPQCCAVDVLGLADLNCFIPSETPASADNFKDICAAVGQQARCCVIPAADQALLCMPPVGA